MTLNNAQRLKRSADFASGTSSGKVRHRMKQVSVVVSPAMKREIEHLSARMGVSQQELITPWVEQGLAQELAAEKERKESDNWGDDDLDTPSVDNEDDDEEPPLDPRVDNEDDEWPDEWEDDDPDEEMLGTPVFDPHLQTMVPKGA